MRPLEIAFMRGLVLGILLCGFGWGLVGYFVLR